MSDNLGMSSLPTGLPITGTPAKDDLLVGTSDGGFARHARGSGAGPNADMGGSVTPNDHWTDIWLKSDNDWSGYTSDHGDDSKDGSTKAKAMMTIDAAAERYSRCGEGETQCFRLAGHGGDDPWDRPTSLGAFPVRQLDVGVSDSWAANRLYWGPRHFLNQGSGGSGHFVSAADLGDGRCKITCDAGGVGVLAFMCWERDNGREVHPPIPCASTSGGFTATHEGYPAASADIMAAHGGGNNIFAGAPAVMICGDGGDPKFRGVHLRGQGCYHIGGRLGDDSSFDSNPLPHLRNVGIERGTCDVLGELMFQNVKFHDYWYARGGSHRYANCISEGSVYIASSLPRFLQPDCQFLPGLEAMARMNTPAVDEYWWNHRYDTDPEFPGEGIDLAIAFGGSLYLGEGVGAHGAALRIIHGLTVWGSGSDAVKIFGPGSGLFMHALAPATPDYADLKANNYLGRLVLNVANAASRHIWARDDGRARINDSDNGYPVEGVPQINCHFSGGTNHLAVSNGDPIQLGSGTGQFRDPASWAGCLDRSLEVNAGGKRINDNARIWDPSWETAAGYNEGTR